MTGGDEPGAEPGAHDPMFPGGRPWQHPSEVGLANRGRADRRRSTLIASGVLLGGVGLLVSGVVMGTSEQSAAPTSSTLPMERAELSVAHVMTDGDAANVVTGVVIDGDGHVLVDGATLEDSDTVWVRCSDGEGGPASVIGRDHDTDMAVLRMDRPGGVPASVADAVPSRGAELRVVRAGQPADAGVELSAGGEVRSGSAQLINLSGTPAPSHFVALLDDRDDAGALRGGMVFDRSGRLAGVIPSGSTSGASGLGPSAEVRVLTAADAVGAVEDLLGDPPG